jgi:hypothetical protein
VKELDFVDQPVDPTDMVTAPPRLRSLPPRSPRGRLQRALADIPPTARDWSLIGSYRTPRSAATTASRVRHGPAEGQRGWETAWRPAPDGTFAVFARHCAPDLVVASSPSGQT